ncbi:MAG: hypothetical protein C4308_04890 [Chitinophagaceae bacterium]
MALQLSYAWRSFDELRKNYLFSDQYRGDTALYFDRAHVYSPIFIAAANLGYLIHFSKSYHLDIEAGYGKKITQTSYSKVVNPQAGYYQIPNDASMINTLDLHLEHRKKLKAPT